MRATGPHEIVVGQAACVAGVEIGSAKTAGAGVHPIPLRVVEYVERLGPELEAHVLSDFEMLEQTHVEVGSRRILHNVALRSSECQAFRRGKCRRIEEQRSNHARNSAWNIGS